MLGPLASIQYVLGAVVKYLFREFWLFYSSLLTSTLLCLCIWCTTCPTSAEPGTRIHHIHGILNPRSRSINARLKCELPSHPSSMLHRDPRPHHNQSGARSTAGRRDPLRAHAQRSSSNCQAASQLHMSVWYSWIYF